MLALFHAAQADDREAAAHGIAPRSVTDAWMSGRSAHYVEMIAKASLVRSTPRPAAAGGPAGGVRPMLGTNRSPLQCRRRTGRSCRHGHLGYM